MKKSHLILTLLSCAACGAYADISITGSTTAATAPALTSDSGRLLWNGIDGVSISADPERIDLIDGFVKVDSNISVDRLYGGGAGRYQNMVVLLEDGKSLTLNSVTDDNTAAIRFNSSSTVPFIYKFQLAKENTIAKVITSAETAYFQMGYHLNSGESNKAAHGIIIDKGVTLSTKNLVVNNNDYRNGSSALVGNTPVTFEVNGNIDVAAGYSLKIDGTPITQGVSSTITTDTLEFVNSNANLGGKTFVNKSLVSDADTTINVSTGATLQIGNSTQNATFSNNGQINVSGLLKIYSASSNASVSTKLGNMTIENGTVSEITTSNNSYNLVANGTVKLTNATLEVVAGNYIGVMSETIDNQIYKGSYILDEKSKLQTNKLVINYGGSFTLADSANINKNTLLLVKDGSGELNLGGTTKYEFGELKFLRNSKLEIYLGDAEVSFTDVLAHDTSKGCNSEIILYDFRNNLISFGAADISDDGVILNDGTNNKITLVAFDTDGNKWTTGWDIIGGYLYNSNLPSSVPEPAEWAVILGTLALALAIYRKRK